jgi:hypothetical protein
VEEWGLLEFLRESSERKLQIAKLAISIESQKRIF